MKLILILILIITIMIIAFRIGQQFREKYDFYYNLKQFLIQFKLNLSFKKDKILEFLNKTKSKKQFKYFIDDYKNYITTGKINLDNISIISNEEKLELEKIITLLGNSDASTEIDRIESFIEVANSNLISAENDKNKICPLIIKLSLLFAVALGIVLI